MEDTTAYIINKSYRNILIPTTLGTVAIVISMLVNVSLITYFEGADGLVVSSLFIPLLTIWGCIYEGLGIGVSSIFSKSLGKGLSEEGKIYTEKANTIVLSLSVLLFLGGLLFTCMFTPHSLGISKSLFIDTVWYARIMFFTTIPLVMNNYLLFLVRADSSQNISGISNGVQVVLNISLDVVFMGVLEMGIKGAALAMLVASSAALIITLCHFLKPSSILRMRFKIPDKGLIVTLSKYAMNTISDNIADMLLSIFVNITVLIVFGIEIASIVYIFNYILMFVMYWGMGIAYSVEPILCVYYGEHNNNAIKLITKKGLYSAIVVGVILSVVIAIFAEFIAVDIFNYEYPQLLSICVEAIRILCLSIPFYLINMMLVNYCQQLEKFKISLLLSLFASLVLPVFFISISILTNKPFIIWWSFLLSESIALTCWTIYMLHVKKKKNLDSILCLPIFASPFKEEIQCLIRKNEIESINDYLDNASRLLEHHHIEETIASHTLLAVKETISYAKETHLSSKGYIALRLGATHDGQIRLMVKLDNENKEMKQLNDKNLKDKGQRNYLHSLQNISSDFRYQRVLSFNTFDMTIT